MQGIYKCWLQVGRYEETYEKSRRKVKTENTDVLLETMEES